MHQDEACPAGQKRPDLSPCCCTIRGMERQHSPPRPAAGSDANGGLLTAEGGGELLGVRKSWVYEQSRAGRTPPVSRGRYRRYRREAIVEWVARIETGWPGGPN